METTAQAECEGLMNAILPLAQEMLKSHRAFHPYGGVVGESGKAEYFGIDLAAGLTPDRAVETIKAALIVGALAGGLRATALVYDVRIVPPSTGIKSDAIAIMLDHRDGYSVIAFLPYVASPSQLVFGQMFGQLGEGEIFSG